MKINIKTLDVDLTPSLKTYVEKKFEALKKFLTRFEEEGDAQILLDLARTTHHHKHGDVFKASVGLRLGKKVLHAEEEADDARVAIDRARDTLRSEIEKYKMLLKPGRGGNNK
jgi:ribosomal subunit interface protein